MSSTSKQRISARGWLTRAARALADLVHEKADKVELVEVIADFGHREGGRLPRCLSETADGGQAAVERYFHHPRRRL